MVSLSILVLHPPPSQKTLLINDNSNGQCSSDIITESRRDFHKILDSLTRQGSFIVPHHFACAAWPFRVIKNARSMSSAPALAGFSNFSSSIFPDWWVGQNNGYK